MARSAPRTCLVAVGLSAALLLTAWPAAADVYRWTDADGQVHYGDRPQGAAARRVAVPPAPAADTDAAERRERRERLLRAYGEERAERAAARERAERERRRRERNCALARKQRYDYEHAGYLYDEDEQGNRRILNDDEHHRALREAADAVARWCGKS